MRVMTCKYIFSASCTAIPYLNFIVLEENIGFEVVDGLIDNVCVFS